MGKTGGISGRHGAGDGPVPAAVRRGANPTSIGRVRPHGNGGRGAEYPGLAQSGGDYVSNGGLNGRLWGISNSATKNLSNGCCLSPYGPSEKTKDYYSFTSVVEAVHSLFEVPQEAGILLPVNTLREKLKEPEFCLYTLQARLENLVQSWRRIVCGGKKSVLFGIYYRREVNDCFRNSTLRVEKDYGG